MGRGCGGAQAGHYGAMITPLHLTQLAVSAMLAGLCWTVQLAVYPRFGHLRRAAGVEAFRVYHAAYTRAMGGVAGPLMVAELSFSLVVPAVAGWTAGNSAGLALTVATWGWTFGVMVPRHARLQAAADEAEAEGLAGWNWPRTAAWTLRTGVALLAAGAV